MRGIEKIVDQILEEAREEEVKILDEAHIEVEKIKEASKEEIDKINTLATKEIEDELIKINELSKLSMEQKRKRAILEKKQEVIKEILDEAYEKLLVLSEDEYFNLLEDILKKAATDKSGEIRFNQKDREKVVSNNLMGKFEEIAREKAGSLSLGEDIDIESGFVLVYGGIEENCTFKALIEAKKEELHDVIQKILF